MFSFANFSQTMIMLNYCIYLFNLRYSQNNYVSVKRLRISHLHNINDHTLKIMHLFYNYYINAYVRTQLIIVKTISNQVFETLIIIASIDLFTDYKNNAVYRKQFLLTSTTATAPELRTQNLSAPTPLKNAEPLDAPYRHTLPTMIFSSVL